MTSVYVSVNIDLDEIGTDDLIKELKTRDCSDLNAIDEFNRFEHLVSIGEIQRAKDELFEMAMHSIGRK